MEELNKLGKYFKAICSESEDKRKLIAIDIYSRYFLESKGVVYFYTKDVLYRGFVVIKEV